MTDNIWVETDREDDRIYSKVVYMLDQYTMICLPLDENHVTAIAANDMEETYTNPSQFKNVPQIYTTF